MECSLLFQSQLNAEGHERNIVPGGSSHNMRGGNGGNNDDVSASMRLDMEWRVWHTLRARLFDIPSRGVILSSIGEIYVSV